MPLDTTSHALPVARTIKDLRAVVQAWRAAGETVALVPTMGALHSGHISLVDLGRAQADHVVVSIFVNPTQFAPGEDFEAYPRTEGEDAKQLLGKADLIFAPNAGEMYPDGFSTTINLTGVTAHLEGLSRPTHFAGVATVVCKLLLACMPDVALFGQKDYQQLLVIQTMVRDLNLPIKIVGAPIARAPDGLALSSRNIYLTKAERLTAPHIHRILTEAAQKAAQGENIEALCSHGVAELIGLGFEPDYLEIRDAVTLAPFESGIVDAPARALVAAQLGQPRLIDNIDVPST
ncbi:MAG: pantoate--beta-alanine ligase [Parvibaculaceae bacterium]|nr:pantoate--beta-alanine ligase [Parvibaculaceae bacterium]